MEKYGFFGGSFNPVTKAHVELAQAIVEKYDLDKVIFVPVGDNYEKKGLANEKHRYNMLKIAIREYEKLEVSDIELNQDKNLTTLEAFKKIEARYPEVEKYYIMGTDNMHKMIVSEDFDTLVKNYKYIIIQRGIIDGNELINSNNIFIENKDNFMVMENKKHKETSATKVREKLLKANEIQEDIMDEGVINYIMKNGLY